MTALITAITTTLWKEISAVFVNVFYAQNIPINQSQSYVGVILFAGVIISGIFLVQYFLRINKKKAIEVPPEGIKYDQIACPHCNHPNIV